MTGSDFSAIDDAAVVFIVVAVISVISFPLAIWKLVDIIIWIIHHIHIGVTP